jgi:glycosyltransferase involved in cell wall biosynthesis
LNKSVPAKAERMSTTLPTVSVVVPCYRYGSFLEQCVTSILSQKGVDVRVLIIDDASPDDSFQVAQKLAAGDARVQARRHQTNQGHIATYNEGLLEWAEGEFSVLISADDLLAEGALARAVTVMRQHPNVGLVYGHAIKWIDDRPLPKARIMPSAVRVWGGHDWARTVCRLGHNIVTCPEVVVRTALQRQVGGYSPELPHTADLHMWLRFAARADVAYIEGVDQAYYRVHSSNMSRSRSPAIDLEQRSLAFSTFLSSHGNFFDDAAKLSRAAQCEIAKEALWCARRAYEKRQLRETPVHQLKQLARAVYPDCHTLLEFWGLRWCEFVGTKLAPRLQLFVLAAVYRRLRSTLWLRRWHQKGY